MSKSRHIPVYLEGREIEKCIDRHSSIHKLYEKWWRIFGIKKIYRVAGKAFYMENKYRPAWEIK